MDPDQLPLRDLHRPDPVGWWPLAPGWWLLLATLAMLLIWLAVVLRSRHRRGAARRHAVRALQRLERRYAADGDAVQLAIGLSALLRRAMLAYAPRATVAGLTGAAWLEWLDSGLGEPLFTAGAGRALIDLPYRRPGGVPERGPRTQPGGGRGVAGDGDIEALLHAVRRRLATPHPGPRRPLAATGALA